MKHLAAVALILASLSLQAQTKKIEKLNIRILSTMLADRGIGEWGFCALIEFDGKKILFDTGARPETVFNNATELGVDLSDVTDVFISHSHGDHTGGLALLRERFAAKNPKALSVAHIGEGAFYPRNDADYNTSVTTFKNSFEKSGGRFIVYNGPKQIYPGVWITGPVPRTHDERNWSTLGKLTTPDGKTIEDNVPEDQSLVFNTTQGTVVVSGCGHSGVINTLAYTQQFQPGAVHALIGGFHLFALNDDKLNWTIDQLRTHNVKNFIGAHCTGIHAVYAIQKGLSLDRAHCVVGAVGASFVLGEGIHPGVLAK